jgi:hypothetical protein
MGATMSARSDERISEPKLEEDIRKMVTDRKPETVFDLGFVLAELPSNGLEELSILEELYGEELRNDWLVEVVASTGIYEIDRNSANSAILIAESVPHRNMKVED